jgi:hypothetical protein
VYSGGLLQHCAQAPTFDGRNALQRQSALPATPFSSSNLIALSAFSSARRWSIVVASAEDCSLALSSAAAADESIALTCRVPSEGANDTNTVATSSNHDWQPCLEVQAIYRISKLQLPLSRRAATVVEFLVEPLFV